MFWNMRWCLTEFCRHISMERALRYEIKMFSSKNADAVEENRGISLDAETDIGFNGYTENKENFSVEIRFHLSFPGINVRPGRKCCVSHHISCILHRRHTCCNK